MQKLRKKQKWFFDRTEELLEKMRDEEFRDELERRQLRMTFRVSYPDQMIVFSIIDTMRGNEILWSSLTITNIVDRDIAIEHLREWIKAPQTKGDDAPDPEPASPKTTEPGNGM